MSTKGLAFYTTAWVFSIMICLILEGTWFGAHNTRTVINDLIPITTLNVGGVVPIPAFNIYFFRGIIRVLLFDYSFYTGAFEFLRWVWVVIFTPAAVWGIGSTFASVFANFLRVL